MTTPRDSAWTPADDGIAAARGDRRDCTCAGHEGGEYRWNPDCPVHDQDVPCSAGGQLPGFPWGDHAVDCDPIADRLVREIGEALGVFPGPVDATRFEAAIAAAREILDRAPCSTCGRKR